MSNKVNIDGREYDVDALSDNVKAQLVSLQFVDAEIQRLQGHLAAMQTARNAYAQAVNQELAANPVPETIQFK